MAKKLKDGVGVFTGLNKASIKLNINKSKERNTEYWEVFLYFSFFSVDVDECSNGNDPCYSQATCSNTDGSFTCNCNSGYSWNGTSCQGRLFVSCGKETLDPFPQHLSNNI